jgi:hypothetical protein
MYITRFFSPARAAEGTMIAAYPCSRAVSASMRHFSRSSGSSSTRKGEERGTREDFLLVRSRTGSMSTFTATSSLGFTIVRFAFSLTKYFLYSARAPSFDNAV